MSRAFLIALLFVAATAHARIIAGEARNFSSVVDPQDARLVDCVHATLDRHIGASGLKDVKIDARQLSISKCWYYDCLNVSFTMENAQDQFRGQGSVIVDNVDAAGAPVSCRLWERDTEFPDEIIVAHGHCNPQTKDSLQVTNQNHLVVVNGCARD